MRRSGGFFFFFLIEAGFWFLWSVLVAPVTFKIQRRRYFIKAGEILTDDHKMLAVSDSVMLRLTSTLLKQSLNHFSSHRPASVMQYEKKNMIHDKSKQHSKPKYE